MKTSNFLSNPVRAQPEQRRTWTSIYISVVIVVVALLGLPQHSAQAAEEHAGVILAFTGKVEVQHGQEKHAPAIRAEIYSGDTIITAIGQVQIRFDDGTLLTLYRDTKFSVDEYRYTKGKGGDRAQFSLVSGVMHTLTGEIDKNNYLVKTRLANLGVRGTEYSAQLGDALHVSVDQGRVELVNAGGSMFIGPGQSIVVMGANAMPKPVLGGKVNLGGGPGGRGGQGGGQSPAPVGPGGGPGAGPGGSVGAAGGMTPPPPPPSGTQKY
jgi:hypothetical protein